MEFAIAIPPFVLSMCEALRKLKDMYDKRGINNIETLRLQEFMEDYKDRISEILAGYKRSGVCGRSLDDLSKLKTVIRDATNQLNGWARRNRRFFDIFTSAQRRRKLEGLTKKVMDSSQKVVGFMTLDWVNMQQELLVQLLDIRTLLEELLERQPRALRNRRIDNGSTTEGESDHGSDSDDNNGSTTEGESDHGSDSEDNNGSTTEGEFDHGPDSDDNNGSTTEGESDHGSYSDDRSSADEECSTCTSRNISRSSSSPDGTPSAHKLFRQDDGVTRWPSDRLLRRRAFRRS